MPNQNTITTTLKSFLSNRLWLHTPSPKQKLFHSSHHPRRMIRAATQTGKTHCGAHEAWYQTIGYSPYRDIPAERLLRSTGIANPTSDQITSATLLGTQSLKKPTTGLILVANWTAMVDVVGRKMWEIAPRELLAPGSDWNPRRGWSHQRILLRDGSQILFRSMNSSSLSVAGMTIDWVWIDEPPTAEIFSEAMSRVAVRNGIAWMTFTPVGRELTWLRKHVEGDPEKGEPPREDWEQFVMHLTAQDCPHRSQASIDAQTASYGAWEFNQRVFGAWEGVTDDRTISSFSEDNVVELDVSDLTGNWNFAVGMDHGILAGKQTAVLLGYKHVTERGNKILHVVALDEAVREELTGYEQDAEDIRSMLARWELQPQDVDIWVGDINNAGKGAGSRTVNEVLGSLLSVTVDTPYKRPGSVDAGVKLMGSCFADRTLLVNDRCRRLIRALKHWKGDSRDPLKDVLDAFRYATWEVYEHSSSGRSRLELVRA